MVDAVTFSYYRSYKSFSPNVCSAPETNYTRSIISQTARGRPLVEQTHFIELRLSFRCVHYTLHTASYSVTIRPIVF